MAKRAPTPSESMKTLRLAHRQRTKAEPAMRPGPKETPPEGVFLVVGRHVIAGSKKGERLTLPLDDRTKALVDAGHIEPVAKEEPKKTPQPETGKVATNAKDDS